MSDVVWNVKEVNDVVVKLEDPEGWYSATVKSDGCLIFIDITTGQKIKLQQEEKKMLTTSIFVM